MLNAKAFSLAAAIVWSATIFITTLISVATGFAKAFLEAYGSLHPGYSISLAGAFIGLVYAFICAGIGSYVLVWLYNKLEKKIEKYLNIRIF